MWCGLLRVVRHTPAPIVAYGNWLRLPPGWRRELVQRAASDDSRSGGGIRADAYYFSPSGKKLRSIKETEVYCEWGVWLRRNDTDTPGRGT